MKVEWVGQHPDEGSIHAWLDGELDPSDAALLDEHVRGCDDCAARVAEARGLMAGASRVVGQLDVTPSRLIQPARTPTLDDSGSMWRLMRVTPARAGIAAVLLVGLGITLTRSRVARESSAVPRPTATVPASGDAMTAMAAPKEAAAPVKDNLLDSAIARRLANEHPARTVERAPGVAIPSPEGPTVAAAVPDTTAPQRVAAARVSIRSSRDSASPPADRARVGFNSGAVVNADRMATAGQAAEAAGFRNELSAKVAGIVVSVPTAACYLVESSAPGAHWGSVTLPMVLAFDSAGTTARVLTPNGADTEMRAVRMAGRTDSLVLRMRRIGYDGTLALDAIGEARGGAMRSSQSTVRLEQAVVTGVGEERRTSVRSDTRVPQPAAAPPAVARKIEPAREAAAAPAPGAAGAAVAITAHVVSCTSGR
ncbi:MAG: hypothetical protein JWL95_1560 [Gemmatimonadetes bacterium]|nr:hypothetical protein [Gemmatimonadota bacterium]